MAGKREKQEDIVLKLRQVGALQRQGKLLDVGQSLLSSVDISPKEN